MRVVKDRRSSLRVVIHGEVWVYTERDRLEAMCLDLSMSGMLVQSARPTQTRRLVTLEAFLAGERLRLDAELCRHRQVGEGHELAFVFVDVIPEVAGQIERIIHARLAASSQRDYAQAFAHGQLGGSAPPGSPVAPGLEHEGSSSVTEVASSHAVPVISGLTQAIDVEAPRASITHTVVASAVPGPRERTMAIDAAEAGAWDEEVTAKFRRITDDVGPGHTVRMDREGRPLPPEPTRVVSVSELGGRAEPEPTPARAKAEPPEDVADAGVPEPVMAAETEALAGARPRVAAGPPTMRLPFAAGLVRSMVRAADEGPTPKAPEPARRERESTKSEPRPPTMLRGEIDTSPPPVSPSEPPRHAERASVSARPSQLALLEARALLRPRAADAPPRRPRVIVAIPHRTYARSRRAPWLR